MGPRPPRALQALAKRCKGVNLRGYIADVVPFCLNARRLVLEQYDAQVALRALDDAYEEAVAYRTFEY